MLRPVGTPLVPAGRPPGRGGRDGLPGSDSTATLAEERIETAQIAVVQQQHASAASQLACGRREAHGRGVGAIVLLCGESLLNRLVADRAAVELALQDDQDRTLLRDYAGALVVQGLSRDRILNLWRSPLPKARSNSCRIDAVTERSARASTSSGHVLQRHVKRFHTVLLGMLAQARAVPATRASALRSP